MEHRRKLRFYAGCMFLLLLIAMNVFIAARYYNLDCRKLPQFFIWQTNIEAKQNVKK